LTLEDSRSYFSLAIIAITLAGMLIGLNGDDMRDMSTLFALDNGLQYSTILQTAGFSFIIAVFSILLFSERSFVVSFALTLLILKLEGKKYNKLLENYKVRHSNLT
jgi:hypothetical protein